MYKPDSDCVIEKEIRADMAQANYAGQAGTVRALVVRLSEHRKSCPVCHGVTLASVLFGQVVVVAQ